MATVRKRTRIAANGEEKISWVADYFDQHKKRHIRTFKTRKAADAWLVETRGRGQPRRTYPRAAVDHGL